MINLIAKILNPKGFLIGAGIVLLIVGYVWITSFTVVKKTAIEEYESTIESSNKNVEVLANEIKVQSDSLSKKDSILLFQSDRINGLQQSLKDTKIMLVRSQNEAKTANEAISHYEENGLMRYFKEKKRLFGKDCYIEIFEKPDCIEVNK